MSEIVSNSEERFATIVGALLDTPGVTPPEEGNRFGSAGLKVHDKIFAMLVRGELVVKLPKNRVDALVEAGEGKRFTANRDRPMKEWVVLSSTSQVEWLLLAQEALAFVATKK